MTQQEPLPKTGLQPMERNDLPIVVIRLCFGGRREYLGRVASLDDLAEYKSCSGFRPGDITHETWAVN